jgi:hypothetical protein
MSHGWIGVDLDGTLAEYHGWKGVSHIGAPIAPMVKLVQRWLFEGKDVRVFTARAYIPPPGPNETLEQRATRIEREKALDIIERWCSEHIGTVLPITCIKDYSMVALYDDRCVQVEHNTGRLIGESN